jgi:hypothetical protein
MINTLKAKRIKKDYGTQDIKRTNSYWFLLPMLELKRVDLFKNGLVNCYLDDNLNNFGHENCLHLLFNYKNLRLSKFNDFLDELTAHSLYVDLYDTQGPGDVMVVFKIPDEYLTILKQFKEGKYSEFSKEYKHGFFSKNEKDGSTTEQWKILHKHEDIRKKIEKSTNEKIPESWEVWSIPIPQEEIYMYNENILNNFKHEKSRQAQLG